MIRWALFFLLVSCGAWFFGMTNDAAGEAALAKVLASATFLLFFLLFFLRVTVFRRKG